MRTHWTFGHVVAGFVVGVALSIGSVGAWHAIHDLRAPALVSEVCEAEVDSVAWCVQLRDDGSDRGLLYIALQRDGVDVGRYTVIGSPFTSLGYQEDLDVSFEPDRIVVRGWRGGELVLPAAVYELN